MIKGLIRKTREKRIERNRVNSFKCGDMATFITKK